MVASMMRVNRRVNALNAQQEAAMAADHAKMGSNEDAAKAVSSAAEVTNESFESAIAGAVFEREHVKSNPDEAKKSEK